MQDRPDAVELLAAVQHFLEHEVLPLQDDQRVRFRTRVAANALAILQRELGAGSAPAEQESERLRALLQAAPAPAPAPVLPTEEVRDYGVGALRREIARRIRSGEADDGPWRQAVLTTTLASVEAKLAISNPKLLNKLLERRPRD